MTVDSHYNEKNILKRISRSNGSDVPSNSSISIVSTIRIETFESNNSIASSKPSSQNDGQASLTLKIPLQDDKTINEVDNFQNTLPDQSMILYIFFLIYSNNYYYLFLDYGNFVIVIFFSAMLILILGKNNYLFLISYVKYYIMY